MAPTDPNSEIGKLLQRLPDTAEVLALRAMSMAEAGDVKGAESVIREALSRHQTPVLSVTLGRILIRQDRHKEAMAEMVSVLRRQPDNAGALAVLASCLLECGEHERGRKMTSKARSAGAPAHETRALEERHAELTGTSPPGPHSNAPDRTQPEESPAPSPDITRPGDESPTEVRKRQRTLMGRPTQGDFPFASGKNKPPSTPPQSDPPPNPPRRLPPPPLQSGTFASLDTYEVEGEDEDAEPTFGGADRVRLTDEGPLEPIADPDDRTLRNADIALPDDETFAARLGEVMANADLASPNDQTAHIILSDDDFVAADDSNNALPRRGADRPRGPEASVEYDAGFAAEARDAQRPAASGGAPPHAPPADLDDLPTYESELPQLDGPYYEVDPTAPDLPMTHEDFVPERTRDSGVRGAGLPNLDPAMLFDDESLNDFSAPNVHAVPPNAPAFADAPSDRASNPWNDPGAEFRPRRNASSQPGSGAPIAPVQRPAPHFAPSGNEVPGDRRFTPDAPPRREETAVAAEPRKPPASKKWIAIGLVAVIGAFAVLLGVSFAASSSLKSDIRGQIDTARTAMAPDTYDGYLAAEKQLETAIETESFLGASFDDVVETVIPFEAFAADSLRDEAIAELALVAAILEYRFESAGTHKAKERAERARAEAPGAAEGAVAAAYIAMTNDRPQDALAELTKLEGPLAADSAVVIAKAWALLALDRPADAALAVQPLRDAESPGIQARYLLASVDAARGDESASKAFAEVFAESEDHVDARIGRSYTLRKNAEDITKAQNVLDTVLVKLQRKASRFQQARATSAYGSVYLAEGDEQRAEDRLRDAIRKMPNRSELYLPLLQFYGAQGRVEEVEKTLEKAKQEKAYSPRMALYEARMRLFASQPQKTLEIVEKLGIEDGQSLMLQALALIDMQAPAKAVELLQPEGTAKPDPAVNAVYHLARSLSKPEALEDSRHQTGRLKEQNADDAIVHWAAGRVALAVAERTPNEEKRNELLQSARADLERAIELEKTWSPSHVELCNVFAHSRDLDKGRAHCKEALKLTPNYLPALLAAARIEIVAGDYDEAEQFSQKATAARPSDWRAGLLAARVAIEKRDIATGLTELNRWLSKPVDKFELNLLEGRLEFARKEYTRAANYLQEAYEMRPTNGEAAVYYAHTLARLGQEKPASEILLENLSHPVWGGYAWAVLGETRRMQRRLRDAGINFSKAEKLLQRYDAAPKYWSYLYAEWALAEKVRYRKWRHARVLDKLREARKKGDADDPELNLMWGRYHLEKRRPDYDAAIRSIERVAKVAPYHCEAFETLLSLYQREERDEDAAALEGRRTDNCPKSDASKNK